MVPTNPGIHYGGWVSWYNTQVKRQINGIKLTEPKDKIDTIICSLP